VELRAKRTSPTFWGRYDKLLITSGLSKAFGMPGARIGWVVGPAKTVEMLWSYRDYTTLTPSALGEHLATIAMEPKRREWILARTKDIVRRQWPGLEGWLNANDDILFCTPPDAGAIALVGYRLPITPGKLFERLRVERSVLVNGADHYGMSAGSKYFRVGFGYDSEVLEKGLGRIGKLLRQVQKGG
jgi:hypothetical protein